MNQWEVHRPVDVLPEFVMPLAYTSFRTIRMCPLQLAFSRDKRYPAKTNPSARMGTAFHATLAYIAGGEPTSVQDVLEYFLKEICTQRDVALANFRERRLPWPRDLREAMENTLAIRFASRRQRFSERVHKTETTLISPDGLLMGRPDDIISDSGSVVVVDYKTGLPRDEDMSFYEEQINFYAGLWAEIHEVMPNVGRVEFLLSGFCHEFSLNGEQCTMLLSQAREIAGALKRSQVDFNPKAGDYCQWCYYRPWCEEYWLLVHSTASEESTDLHGFVCSVHPGDSHAICLQSNHDHISIVNKDIESLPIWKSGSELRSLTLSGHGNIRFRTRYTEIFQVIGVEPSPEEKH